MKCVAYHNGALYVCKVVAFVSDYVHFHDKHVQSISGCPNGVGPLFQLDCNCGSR